MLHYQHDFDFELNLGKPQKIISGIILFDTKLMLAPLSRSVLQSVLSSNSLSALIGTVKAFVWNKAERTKVMTNNAEGIRGNIRINDKGLETVNQFKYLGTMVTDETQNQKFTQG